MGSSLGVKVELPSAARGLRDANIFVRSAIIKQPATGSLHEPLDEDDVGSLSDFFPRQLGKKEGSSRTGKHSGGIAAIKKDPACPVNQMVVGAIINQENTLRKDDRRRAWLHDSRIKLAAPRGHHRMMESIPPVQKVRGLRDSHLTGFILRLPQIIHPIFPADFHWNDSARLCPSHVPCAAVGRQNHTAPLPVDEIRRCRKAELSVFSARPFAIHVVIPGIGQVPGVDGKGPGRKDAQLCLATSPDLIHWQRRGVILPAYRGAWNVGWTKSGAIVPVKISGKYWMYYLGEAKDKSGQMGVAESTDFLHWRDALHHPVVATRRGQFDSRVVEPGPPPVVLPQGILLIYNGADDHLVYRTGWVLFDHRDPTRVLARARTPLFFPELPWEKIGQTPNVVFVEGLVETSSRWLFYYGGADKYVGVAEAASR